MICRVHLGNQPENCVTVTTGTMVKGGLSNEVENGSAIAHTMPGCKMSSAPTHIVHQNAKGREKASNNACVITDGRDLIVVVYQATRRRAVVLLPERHATVAGRGG